MSLNFSPRLNQSIAGLSSPLIYLGSGQTWLIPPENWLLKPGKYTAIQQLDPITGIWRTIGGGDTSAAPFFVTSDGQNYRLANQTGCAVGALLTTAGSGYTSAPAVAASAGNSIWRAIVGGAVSTSVTVTNGGVNYTYPPAVAFSLPPLGGLPATGYCTLSGGAVSTVVITNQGAGYTSAPTIVFINDYREISNPLLSDGYGASAVATLTGAGTVTGVVCTDHGNGGLTAVPTLAFSGGGGASAAATAIMCWSITAYAVTSGGAAYSGDVLVNPYDVFPATAAAYTNPDTQSGLVKTRSAQIVAALSAGAITATGQNVLDGGIFTTAPNQMTAYNTPPTTAAALTFTMGGQIDKTTIFPV